MIQFKEQQSYNEVVNSTPETQDMDKHKDDELEETDFKWQELLMFEKGFWLMAVDCLFTFSIIETTVAIGTDIMEK